MDRPSSGQINLSTFRWIDQSIHALVSTTGQVPKFLKSNAEKKQARKQPFEASPEQFWCPELLGGFLGSSEATWIDGQTVKMDRSIYPRFGGYIDLSTFRWIDQSIHVWGRIDQSIHVSGGQINLDMHKSIYFVVYLPTKIVSTRPWIDLLVVFYRAA